MSTRLDSYLDLGLLILRVGFGLSFTWFHGLPKLLGGPDAWARTGSAMENVGIVFGHSFWGLAAALSESLGGVLFAAGLFFRPVCLAMLSVMAVATLEQFGRPTPAPEHAFKNAFVFAGMLLAGPGRYTLKSLLKTAARARS